MSEVFGYSKTWISPFPGDTIPSDILSESISPIESNCGYKRKASGRYDFVINNWDAFLNFHKFKKKLIKQMFRRLFNKF